MELAADIYIPFPNRATISITSMCLVTVTASIGFLVQKVNGHSEKLRRDGWKIL